MEEEEVNYVTVTFKAKGFSTPEKPNTTDIIYDEVKTKEKGWDVHPVITEGQTEAPLSTPLTLVVKVLGVTCLILVSVIIVLIVRFTSVLRRQNLTLTEENLQLQTEKSVLERKMEDLSRERNRLNWTIELILEYDVFPVTSLCPQKVCKPCRHDWLLFQSSCYLFVKENYFKNWKNWKESQSDCREHNADLVVIDSQEEQEFINNHTEKYNDAKHGYWIGLSRGMRWIWVDGSNLTETYWSSQGPGYTTACALSNPAGHPLANWDKLSCTMKNRWICETKALIQPD